jgi:gliding motility-associated-like protein
MPHFTLDISTTCMKIRLLLLGIAVMFTSLASAQMIGVTVEVDTAFYGPNTPTPDDTFDPAGLLDGYVTYHVFAEFTNPTDVLSALYADVAALGTPAMYINAPCGCHNPVSGSMAMDGTNPSGFWIGPFADFEFDTYWTIGMPSSDAPGMIPQAIGLPAGAEICGTQITNGSVFAPGSPINAIAGDDLRVLIAQVTTCGDWCFNANFQVFIEGNQTDNQFYSMLDEVCTTDPCEVYLEEEATVTGNILPCAGGESTVVVEFIGDGDMSLADFQLLDEDGNLVAGPQNSTSFDNLGPGMYTMIVLDEFTCRDTTAFEVIEPDPIVAVFELLVDNACFGEGDATVCIDAAGVSGGTGTLTIEAFDPSGAVIPSIDGLNECWTNLICQDGDGAFTFSVSDFEGCEADTIIYVNCPLPITDSISTINVDCQGNANASIYGEATGGSGDVYLYVNGDSLIAPNTFTGLVPGTYNVQVIDAFGCTPGAQVIEITEPTALSLLILAAAPISCGSDCNGAVTLEYAGGTGEISLTIYDILTEEISNSLDSLCASEYTASVIDENGCETIEPFLIDAPPPLEFLISPTSATCTGMSDGSVDIFPAGGTGELTWYVVDTLGNEANLNNLSEMTYTAYVIDVLGCEMTDTFNIEVEIVTDMILTTFASPVTCWNTADGTITVSVQGGNEPLTYLWSDPYGQTSATAVELTEDSYSITVTDSIGCNLTVAAFVDHIEGCLFIADAITPNGDGYNDQWIVGGLQDFPESSVMVYNRYGQLLYSSEPGEDVHWDGRHNNNRLPVADYYYVISLNPSDAPITGTVSLKY